MDVLVWLYKTVSAYIILNITFSLFHILSLEILCLYGMNCPLQSENQKFCEQLRVNALSVSVLPPSSLSLTTPETMWLSLFPPRSFGDATLLYTQPLEDPDVISEPPQLAPGLQAKFGPVVTDLYCMARTRAPLHKLQLLTSAFRKTMASLSALKLQSLLEEGDSLCVRFGGHYVMLHVM